MYRVTHGSAQAMCIYVKTMQFLAVQEINFLEGTFHFSKKKFLYMVFSK